MPVLTNTQHLLLKVCPALEQFSEATPEWNALIRGPQGLQKPCKSRGAFAACSEASRKLLQEGRPHATQSSLWWVAGPEGKLSVGEPRECWAVGQCHHAMRLRHQAGGMARGSLCRGTRAEAGAWALVGDCTKLPVTQKPPFTLWLSGYFIAKCRQHCHHVVIQAL